MSNEVPGTMLIRGLTTVTSARCRSRVDVLCEHFIGETCADSPAARGF